MNNEPKTARPLILNMFSSLVAHCSSLLPGADVTIRYRPGSGTTVRGRVARAKHGAIAEFFGRDLRPGGAVTVRADRGPNRSYRFRFSGALTPFQRQRARNFLLEHLK